MVPLKVAATLMRETMVFSKRSKTPNIRSVMTALQASSGILSPISLIEELRVPPPCQRRSSLSYHPLFAWFTRRGGRLRFLKFRALPIRPWLMGE